MKATKLDGRELDLTQEMLDGLQMRLRGPVKDFETLTV